jgi:hypothetical protein
MKADSRVVVSDQVAFTGRHAHKHEAGKGKNTKPSWHGLVLGLPCQMAVVEDGWWWWGCVFDATVVAG